MTHYLDKHFDWYTDDVVYIYDEMPLWSAMPGQLLLSQIPLASQMQVLDIGFGTGFPLLHLAQRLGASSTVYGLDLWENAIRKAQKKVAVMGLNNVKILQADAANIPIDAESIDLICSNLGINNFANPTLVLQECYRVLKDGGHLGISSNLVGTFQVFYDCFLETAHSFGDTTLEAAIEKHIQERSTVDSIENLFRENGLKITKQVQQVYQMRFLDGSAFLNDYFIIMGFLPSWKALLPKDEQLTFFTALENRLNTFAAKHGELSLPVPIAYVEGQK